MTGLLGRVLDLVYPRTCEVCGGEVDRPGRYVCSGCLMRLSFVPTKGCCRRCGRDVAGLDREFVCEDCRTHRPSFDRVASVLRFDGEARQMLLDFKFQRHLWLRDDFTDWLEGTVRARFRVNQIALVLPMPTSFRHRWDRGYNQCDYLAQALAKRLGVPFSKHVVKRVGDPARQGGLSEEDRRENIKGTFVVTRWGRRWLTRMPRGSSVLVVDDVMTTGSTLSECAKTLKDAGFKRIWCVSLLRSLRER